METSPLSTKPEDDAHTAYRKQIQIAKDRLLTITHAIELRDHARQQEGCSGRPALWTQVGDIAHVNELLRDLCEFLGTDAAEDPDMSATKGKSIHNTRFASMIAEGLNAQPGDEGFRAPKKPACKLVGTDGNAFAIMGTVSRALKRAGQPERAAEWQKQAMACKSYDDLLALCFEFVEVR